MADEDKKNATPETENTGLDEAATASPQAEPQGEVAIDGDARTPVLGEEDQDKEFDAVSHGQQTALENHRAERNSQPTS